MHCSTGRGFISSAFSSGQYSLEQQTTSNGSVVISFDWFVYGHRMKLLEILLTSFLLRWYCISANVHSINIGANLTDFMHVRKKRSLIFNGSGSIKVNGVYKTIKIFVFKHTKSENKVQLKM